MNFKLCVCVCVCVCVLSTVCEDKPNKPVVLLGSGFHPIILANFSMSKFLFCCPYGCVGTVYIGVV